MLIHNSNKTESTLYIVAAVLATCTIAGPLKYGPALSCRNEFSGPVVISIREQTKTFSVWSSRKHYAQIMYFKPTKLLKIRLM